jgi:hypothetical protein
MSRVHRLRAADRIPSTAAQDGERKSNRFFVTVNLPRSLTRASFRFEFARCREAPRHPPTEAVTSDQWRVTSNAPPKQIFEICRIGLGLGRSVLPVG